MNFISLIFTWFMCVFLGCRNCPCPCHSVTSWRMFWELHMGLVYGYQSIVTWTESCRPFSVVPRPPLLFWDFPCSPLVLLKFQLSVFTLRVVKCIGAPWLGHFLAVTLGCCGISLPVWSLVKWAEGNSVHCKGRVEMECSSMLSTVKGIITVLPLFTIKVARC